MDEYIKREDALKIIDNYLKACTEEGKVVADAIRDIVAVITPTADVVPRSEVDAIRKELARYIKRDILRRYSNDKIATAVVLQMSPESFLEKEAEEIVADIERKTLEKMREA